jgi:menaquinone-dependent protoporphyrinogen IX oxidase
LRHGPRIKSGVTAVESHRNVIIGAEITSHHYQNRSKSHCNVIQSLDHHSGM